MTETEVIGVTDELYGRQRLIDDRRATAGAFNPLVNQSSFALALCFPLLLTRASSSSQQAGKAFRRFFIGQEKRRELRSQAHERAVFFHRIAVFMIDAPLKVFSLISLLLQIRARLPTTIPAAR